MEKRMQEEDGEKMQEEDGEKMQEEDGENNGRRRWWE